MLSQNLKITLRMRISAGFRKQGIIREFGIVELPGRTLMRKEFPPKKAG